MNVLIHELADKHGAVCVDMHKAIWQSIDRVRQMKTGLRDLQDLIHPGAVGNAAMAMQFCRDVGETKMAEWLSDEWERRCAALDARQGSKPRLVCQLRPDREGNNVGSSLMNYDIQWNLHGADRAMVGIRVPEGLDYICRKSDTVKRRYSRQRPTGSIGEPGRGDGER